MEAGFDPVKVNVVLERGRQRRRDRRLRRVRAASGASQVRFIEFMPLDASGAWTRDRGRRPGRDRRRHRRRVPARAGAGAGRGAGRPLALRDGGGDVGVIPTVTKPFCGDCDRVRLTADGQFRTCLFATDETDLRASLRGGGADDDWPPRSSAPSARKWAGHRIGQVDFIRPTRSMSQIGG